MVDTTVAQTHRWEKLTRRKMLEAIFRFATRNTLWPGSPYCKSFPRLYAKRRAAHDEALAALERLGVDITGMEFRP